MIRLKDLLKEEEAYQQLPTDIKKHFLEIISTFGQFREQMNRKSDIRNIAETLGGIADAAQEYTLREGGDWFDRVTIKRNMKELKALHEKFQKESLEAKAQEQRLEALYEDMGHVLNRYFEIAEVTEDVMKQRLGLQECKTCEKLK
jgi:predicted Zn-dependent protease with MMP-like domain